MRILLCSQFHGTWIEQEISILTEIGYHVNYIQYLPMRKVKIASEFIRSLIVLIKSLPIMFNIDIIYCWWAFTLSFVCTILAKIFRKIIIVNAIGFEISKEIWDSQKWGALHNFMNKILVTVVLRNATQIITISKQNAIQARLFFNLYPKVIYEGIDITKFINNHVYIKKDNKFIILTVATLSTSNIKRKGLDILVMTIANLLAEGYNVKLIISGEKLDGYQKLSTLACALKINDRVEFTAKLSIDKLIELYSQCDIYVQPSRQEGFPTTLVEALACEKPVISTNIHCIEEVIQNEVDGILVSPGDCQALTNAIRRLLRDACLRQSLIDNSRNKSLLFSRDIRKNRLKTLLNHYNL